MELRTHVHSKLKETLLLLLLLLVLLNFSKIFHFIENEKDIFFKEDMFFY